MFLRSDDVTLRLEMKKGGEDFMEHSQEGFLQVFTIQWAHRKVCVDYLIYILSCHKILLQSDLVLFICAAVQVGLRRHSHLPGRAELNLKSRAFWISWTKMKKKYVICFLFFLI